MTSQAIAQIIAVIYHVSLTKCVT